MKKRKTLSKVKSFFDTKSLRRMKELKELKEITDVRLSCIVSCEKCMEHCFSLGYSKCASICRDCADICALTKRYETGKSKYTAELKLLCSKICKECADECAKHGWHDPICKQCYENCLKCSELCA